MTDYRSEVASRAKECYGFDLAPALVETPDRNGRVYCQSRYIATAPYDARRGEFSTDVSRFRFDRSAS